MAKKDEAIPSIPLMLTAEEAAEFLRISREQVRRLCRLGTIKAVKPGRQYLIARKEIRKLLLNDAK